MVAAVSLFALYVIAANVFLSTRLFEMVVDGKPEVIDIRFERAWTVFPQHVHARKLTIRVRDSSVEWWTSLERVELDLSLTSLLRQRFEASHIRAKGVSYRYRERPEVAPSAEELAALPTIPGFPPYSLRTPTKALPPMETDVWNDALYDSWTVDLEDLAVDDLHEVWVQRTRFAGRSHVEGRFYIKPLRAIEVGPTHVTLENGHFTRSGARIAESFDGSSLDVTFARFDPRTVDAAALVSALTLVSDLHVTVPEASRLLPSVGAGVEGPVDVRAAVRISRGRIQRDSHLLATAREVVTPTNRVTGLFVVEAGVTRDARDRDRLAFRGEVVNGDMWPRAKLSDAHPIVHVPRGFVTGDTSALDLAHGAFADLHLVADAPDGEVLEVGPLSRYFPSTPNSSKNVRARVDAHFEAWLAEKRGTARALIRSPDLEVRLAGTRVHGRTRALVELGTIRFDTPRIEDAALTVEIVGGVMASTAAPNVPLVRLNEAVLAARARAIDLTDPLRELKVSVVVPSADAVSGGLLQSYLPEGSDMKIATNGSRYSLKMDVAIEHQLARGSFDLRSKALRVAFRDHELRGQVKVRARIHDWRWATGNLVLDDARVELDDVTMTKAGATTPGLRIARIGIAAKSKRFEISDPLSKLHLSAWFEGAKVHDVSTLNAFLPNDATFRFEGDEGTFRAHLVLDVTNHVAEGSLSARSTNLGVGGKKLHLRGDTELAAEFSDWNFERRTLAVRDAHVELTRVKGRLGPDDGKPHLSVRRIFFTVRTPELDLARPRLRRADFRLVIDKAYIPRARMVELALSPERIMEIELGTAHLDADLRVSAERRTADGSLEIALTNAAVRLRDLHVSGDFRVHVPLSGYDPDHRALDMSGTRLDMRNVAVTGATAKASQWHGNVRLPRATMRLDAPMTLDAFVNFEGKDSRPLIAILFERDLPKIVVHLASVNNLSASAHVIAGSREFGLLDLDAKGGHFEVRGSYAVRDKSRAGAFVFRKEFVSVGIRIDDHGAHPRFFRLNHWLQKRTCVANAVLEIARQGCNVATTSSVTR
ncbi:MAG: hypothetical protein ACXWUE_41890 [Polyangiales bacterium]